MQKPSKLQLIIESILWPVGMFGEMLASKRTTGKKLLWSGLILFLYFPIWLGLLAVIVVNVPLLGFEMGWIDKPTVSRTVGPSMLPTLKEEDSVTLLSPKKNKIERGDIVTFDNIETEGSSYIKRVVGLGGEKILLKQGVVWINGKPLSEVYTYENRPTFGNTFLTECEEKTIDADSVAVMGDNRALSWDSRAVGWIKTSDITGVVKDTTKPSFMDESAIRKFEQVPLDKKKLVSEINGLRSENKLAPLINNSLITAAAQTRAEEISKNFDKFRNGESSVDASLLKSGYRSNLNHEYVAYGYLTEKELIGQVKQLEHEKKLFLSEKFVEVGIGVVNRQVGGCEYPIVVTVLSWPSVPSYDQAVIDDWKREVGILTENLPDYQSYVGFSSVDQVKLKELINTTSQMIIIADRISKKMIAREWLTAEDYRDIRLYESMIKKHNSLSSELWPSDNVQGASDGDMESAW